MITIKFRGYSDELKSFVYGFYQEVNVNVVVYSYIFWQGNTTPVRTDSVGQFTGLHDKNCKEIYEGDINQFGYVIKYCKEKALFGEYGTRNGIDYDILMSYPIDSKSQIIKGNIYENPELLTD